MLDGLLCRRPCVDIGRMPCQRLWARRPGSVHFRPGQRCWRLSPCPGPVRRPDSCSRRVGRSGKVHWLEKYPKARHRTAFSKLWGARGCSRFKAMPPFLFDPTGRARVIPNLRQPRLTRFINDLVGRLRAGCITSSRNIPARRNTPICVLVLSCHWGPRPGVCRLEKYPKSCNSNFLSFQMGARARCVARTGATRPEHGAPILRPSPNEAQSSTIVGPIFLPRIRAWHS